MLPLRAISSPAAQQPTLVSWPSNWVGALSSSPPPPRTSTRRRAWPMLNGTSVPRRTPRRFGTCTVTVGDGRRLDLWPGLSGPTTSRRIAWAQLSCISVLWLRKWILSWPAFFRRTRWWSLRRDGCVGGMSMAMCFGLPGREQSFSTGFGLWSSVSKTLPATGAWRNVCPGRRPFWWSPKARGVARCFPTGGIGGCRSSPHEWLIQREQETSLPLPFLSVTMNPTMRSSPLGLPMSLRPSRSNAQESKRRPHGDKLRILSRSLSE